MGQSDRGRFLESLLRQTGWGEDSNINTGLKNLRHSTPIRVHLNERRFVGGLGTKSRPESLPPTFRVLENFVGLCRKLCHVRHNAQRIQVDVVPA
jgi:hypothetical protein